MKGKGLFRRSLLVASLLALASTALIRLLYGCTILNENGAKTYTGWEVVRDFPHGKIFWAETAQYFLWFFIPCLVAGLLVGRWQESSEKRNCSQPTPAGDRLMAPPEE